LVLLLSWRESAERLGAPLEAPEARLRALLTQEKARIAAVAEELQRTLRTQAELVEAAVQGKIPAARANRRNRRLAERLEVLRADIAQSNHLLAARFAEDLGGHIALPLERYPKEFRRRVFLRGPRLTASDQWQIAFGIVGVILAIFGVMYFTVWRATVQIAITAPPKLDGRFSVKLQNNTLDPVDFYVPWQSMFSVPHLKNSYGMDVYLRAPDAKNYQRFAGTADAWTGEDKSPDPQTRRIRVEPGLSATVTLDTHALAAMNLPFSGIRVVGSRGNGAVLATRTAER
jgi:hypothetical protein